MGPGASVRLSRSRSASAPPSSRATCTTTPSRRAIVWRAGRSATRDPRRRCASSSRQTSCSRWVRGWDRSGHCLSTGLEYWPDDAKVIQVDRDQRVLGLVKPITVGICGDAQAAARGLAERLKAASNPPACLATSQRRLERLAAEKADWEAELDALSQGAEGELAPRSGAARAGAGAAEGRHRDHRHRQHLLGGEQLPALRAAGELPGRHELRQLRLRLSHGDRRQGRGARPGPWSPTWATVPGA